ncbi:MAG: hypothetical protein ACR2M7_03500 [Bdellovibrionales bacterium]
MKIKFCLLFFLFFPIFLQADNFIDFEEAIFNKDFKSAVLMIQRSKGKYVNMNTVNDGWAPLHTVASLISEASPDYLNLVNTLLQYGAKVNKRTAHNKYTPLHIVLYKLTEEKEISEYAEKVIELLLDQGANINKDSYAGINPREVAEIMESKRPLEIINNKRNLKLKHISSWKVSNFKKHKKKCRSSFISSLLKPKQKLSRP